MLQIQSKVWFVLIFEMPPLKTRRKNFSFSNKVENDITNLILQKNYILVFFKSAWKCGKYNNFKYNPIVNAPLF